MITMFIRDHSYWATLIVFLLAIGLLLITNWAIRINDGKYIEHSAVQQFRPGHAALLQEVDPDGTEEYIHLKLDRAMQMPDDWKLSLAALLIEFRKTWYP